MAGRQPFLRTPRLTLRPLSPADAGAIAAGVGNYDVARWLSVVPYPYTLADAEDFLIAPEGAPGHSWAICDDAGFCGVISLGDELGYWLDRRAWGQGYLTEAGDAVVDTWFAQRRAGDLWADYFVGNTRSARVLGKLGFTPEGSARRYARPLRQEVASVRMRLPRARWSERRRYRLATRRLRLRDLREGDSKALSRIGSDPRVARMMTGLTVPWPQDAVRAWIEASRFRGRPGFRAAICQPSGRVIGAVGLGGDPAGCALFLDPRDWGRGYGTEALSAFLADCLARFRLDRITAGRFADNPASGRLLEKLGFAPVGETTATSAARLEPAPQVQYRLDAHRLRAHP